LTAKIDSTITQGAMCWPNSSMPTIWLAPPNTMALISAASNTEKPLSTASAPNSKPNGATATPIGMAMRAPAAKSRQRGFSSVISIAMGPISI